MKKFLKLAIIICVATLLFLGTIGTTSAVALQNSNVIKIYDCKDTIPDTTKAPQQTNTQTTVAQNNPNTTTARPRFKDFTQDDVQKANDDLQGEKEVAASLGIDTTGIK